MFLMQPCQPCPVRDDETARMLIQHQVDSSLAVKEQMWVHADGKKVVCVILTKKIASSRKSSQKCQIHPVPASETSSASQINAQAAVVTAYRFCVAHTMGCAAPLGTGVQKPRHH